MKYAVGSDYRTFLLSCLLLFFTTAGCRERIKLYVGYTPSHLELVEDWFRPSLTDAAVELDETIWEQTSPTAQFYSAGWSKTVMKKFDLLLRGVEENWGGVFIYSDVDIQFFGDFAERSVERLGDNDVIFQRNSLQPSGICSGFIVCRCNERTRLLWELAREQLASGNFKGDQASIKHVIIRGLVDGLGWGFLPWQEFFGPGILIDTKFFKLSGVPRYVPKAIRMHHANYAVGISAKVKQLRHVRNLVETGVFTVPMPSFLANV